MKKHSETLLKTTIVYNAIKNQQLGKLLKFNFDDAKFALAYNSQISIIAHPNTTKHPCKKIINIQIDDVWCFIPFTYLDPHIILLDALLPYSPKSDGLWLDDDEQEIIDGEPYPNPDLTVETAYIRQAAINSLAALEKMILSLTAGDLIRLKRLAKRRGLTYQTLSKTVLKEFITNQYDAN